MWAMSLRLNACKSALLVEIEIHEQDQRLTLMDADPRLRFSELNKSIRVAFRGTTVNAEFHGSPIVRVHSNRAVVYRVQVFAFLLLYYKTCAEAFRSDAGLGVRTSVEKY